MPQGKKPTMQITDIKLYEKNAKDHPTWHIEKIANSIKAFGCKQPIVLDKDGVLVAGHGRFRAMTEYLGYTVLEQKAATKKGEPVIPYVTAEDLTEDEVKAYRIADNQINALTGQNMALIKEELIELDNNNFDITLTGFDADTIIQDDDNDDVVPETPKDPKSKVGDIFKLGNHTLICGDSTIAENWEKLMGNAKADMVFTDPPYNVAYAGRGKDTSRTILNDDMSDQDFKKFLDGFFSKMVLHTKDGAGWYVFHSTSTQAQFEEAMVKVGLAIKNQLIWNKPTASMGWGDYRWKHEPFYYASKEKCETQFYGDRTHSTIVDLHKTEDQLMKWIKKQQKAEKEGKFTIWTMKRDKVNDYQHPTQKPVELITYALVNSSKQGDVVLDPFMGSGSTLIACEKTNRAAVGFELDPTFVDVIVQRWVDFTGIETITKNGKQETWTKTEYEQKPNDTSTED